MNAAELAPVVGADVPGLAGVPVTIGPIRCAECGHQAAEVRHVRAAGQLVIRLGDDSDCPRRALVLADAAVRDGWLQVVWDGDDQPVIEPADDLSPAPGATDGGEFTAVLACRACGDRRELAPVDYVAGLAAGVLAERARRVAS